MAQQFRASKRRTVADDPVERSLAVVGLKAKDRGPVRERAHLAEDAIADHAAHLWKEAGLDRIEPTGDQLSSLFRAWQRTRKD